MDVAKSWTIEIIDDSTKSRRAGGINDKLDYNQNSLSIALKTGGLSDDKLELLKRFVINRIIPTCKLKDVCWSLDMCILSTTIRKDLTTRTETPIGDKPKQQFKIAFSDWTIFYIRAKQIYNRLCK